MPTVHLKDGRVIHFPDGMSTATMHAELSRLEDVDAGTRKDTPAPERSWTDTAVDALPVIGGTVGSLVGAGKWNPLGMAGAAAGGAGGEFVKQIVNAARGSNDVPSTLSGQFADAAEGGAMQAGIQGGGRLALGAGAKVVKGVRSVAGMVPAESAKKIATEAALDLVPGGRIVRGVTRAAFKAMQSDAPAVATKAGPMSAISEAAAPMVEGFDRYMPNVSSKAPAAAKAAIVTEESARRLLPMFAKSLTEGHGAAYGLDPIALEHAALLKALLEQHALPPMGNLPMRVGR